MSVNELWHVSDDGRHLGGGRVVTALSADVLDAEIGAKLLHRAPEFLDRAKEKKSVNQKATGRRLKLPVAPQARNSALEINQLPHEGFLPAARPDKSCRRAHRSWTTAIGASRWSGPTTGSDNPGRSKGRIRSGRTRKLPANQVQCLNNTKW